MSRMSDYIIEASRLSVKVGHRYILSDIDWQVKTGEHWVVFGLNGSGKTTLLSIIAGFKEPTAGSLKVFGQAYNGDNILDFRRRIGWVSASFYDKLYTRESALDIVLSGKFGTLGLRGAIEDEDVILAKRLLGELLLGDKVNRSFATLSKGERQNVLIARALFARPKLLILDEPCTGLDLYNRAHLFAIIGELAEKSDITIISVTHYVDEVLDIFKKALFLKQGMAAACGDVADVFTSDVFSRLIEYPITLARDEQNALKATAQVPSHIYSLLKEVTPS